MCPKKRQRKDASARAVDAGRERSAFLPCLPLPAWLKQALPWIAAAVILWFLFRRVAPAAAWAAAREADLHIFVPVVVIAVTLWFLLESAAFAYLFSRFNAPLSWSEARSLRAVTYLLTPINWNLGTGAVILHLRVSKRIAALEATSSVLFYVLLDGLVLSGLAVAGVLGLPPSPPVRTITWVAGAILALHVTFLFFFLGTMPPWRWVRRIKAWQVFRTHTRATWTDALTLVAIRGLYFAGFVLFFWAGTHAFDVPVPLPHLAAAVPLILMVGSLPITPAGLGTQQAAMLYFFDPYAEEAQILAYGLAFPVALVTVRCALSLLYIRDLTELRAARRRGSPT